MDKKELLAFYHENKKIIKKVAMVIVIIGILLIGVNILDSVVSHMTENIAQKSAAAEPKVDVNKMLPSYLLPQTSKTPAKTSTSTTTATPQ